MFLLALIEFVYLGVKCFWNGKYAEDVKYRVQKGKYVLEFNFKT
jgi:hypothetical protein